MVGMPEGTTTPLDELAGFLSGNSAASVSPQNPLNQNAAPSANPSNPNMNKDIPGAWANPSNPELNPNLPGAVNNPSNPKYNPSMPGATNNPSNYDYNPAMPGSLTNPASPQLNPDYPGSLMNPANPIHNPNFPVHQEIPRPPGLSDNASLPPAHAAWHEAAFPYDNRTLPDVGQSSVHEWPYPEGESPHGSFMPRKPLLYDHDTGQVHMGPWGMDHSQLIRGMSGRPENVSMGWMGYDPQVRGYDEPDTSTSYGGWYAGYPEVPSHVHQAIEGLNYPGQTGSRQRTADNYTQDTGEWPDPTEPRASEPPAPHGCTCRNGTDSVAKLYCPIHGLDGQWEEARDWSIPESHPVGYPEDQPRGWTDAVHSKTLEGHAVLEDDMGGPWDGVHDPEGVQKHADHEDTHDPDQHDDEGVDQRHGGNLPVKPPDVKVPPEAIDLAPAEPVLATIDALPATIKSAVQEAFDQETKVREQESKITALDHTLRNVVASIQQKPKPKQPRKLTIHRDDTGRMAAISHLDAHENRACKLVIHRDENGRMSAIEEVT